MSSVRQKDGVTVCARCGRRGQNGFELNYAGDRNGATYGKPVCRAKNFARCVRRALAGRK